jgi:hypothetical protein
MENRGKAVNKGVQRDGERQPFFQRVLWNTIESEAKYWGGRLKPARSERAYNYILRTSF